MESQGTSRPRVRDSTKLQDNFRVRGEQFISIECLFGSKLQGFEKVEILGSSSLNDLRNRLSTSLCFYPALCEPRRKELLSLNFDAMVLTSWKVF